MARSDATLVEHSAFFDQLVELVPAKYYHESDHEQTNPRFLKKAERAAARAAAKEHYKKAKKAKLDPDQAKTSLDVQRDQAEAKDAKLGDGSEASGVAGPSNATALQFNIGAGASREALKAKLHAKLEALRKQRKMEERVQTAAKAQEWLKKKTEEGRKKGMKGSKPKAQAGQNGAKAAVGESTSLEFGNMKSADTRGKAEKRSKKPKPTKAQLLEKAIAKKEKEAAAAGTKEGEAAAQEEAFRKAAARARGEAVLDDPKLLRRSMKKENRVKAKSREAWQERKKKEAETKDATQKRRKDNLKKRADSKIQKKKDKRDKKLLRAGFEGRKIGPIQKNK